MYLQEIVISPDVFECIVESIRNPEIDFNLTNYRLNLKNKKLILDGSPSSKSIIYEAIENLKSTANNFEKAKINVILREFENSGRQDFRELTNVKEYTSSNNVNVALALGFICKSKIVNSENRTARELKTQFEELANLEILTINEMSEPPHFKCKVHCLQTKTIRFLKSEMFFFEEYLEPYLSDAKHVTFTDIYLRRRRAFENLLRMLTICHSIEKVRIVTATDQYISKNPTYKKFDNDLTEADILRGIVRARPQLSIENIEFISSASDDHPRIIETDTYEITIDPGFDFVLNDYRVRKKLAEFVIRKKITI